MAEGSEDFACVDGADFFGPFASFDGAVADLDAGGFDSDSLLEVLASCCLADVR